MKFLIAILILGSSILSFAQSESDPYGVRAEHYRQENQKIQTENDRFHRMVAGRAVAKAVRVGRSAAIGSTIVVVKCPNGLGEHAPSVNPAVCVEVMLQNGLKCWAHANDNKPSYPEDVEGYCVH